MIDDYSLKKYKMKTRKKDEKGKKDQNQKCGCLTM